MPGGGPGGAGGGDEKVGWEGLTPEELCEGGDGVWVDGHFDSVVEVAAVGCGGGGRRDEERGAEE